MAVLSPTDRTRIWRGFQRYISKIAEALGLNKADLLAAVEATDDWINDNQANYNAALPLAAQTGLTTSQKTLLFCAVALLRTGEVNLLKRVFGEVD